MQVGDATEAFVPRLRAVAQARLRKTAAALEEAAGRLERSQAEARRAEHGAAPPCVILLDEPAFAAAWALQRGVAPGLEAALAQWLEFARSSVRQWEQDASRVLLLDASSRDAAELAEAVASWDETFTGLTLTHVVDRHVDATLLGLARRACHSAREVEQVLADLATAGLVFEQIAIPVEPVQDAEPASPPAARTYRPVDGSDQESVRLRQCLDDTQRELEAVYIRLLQATDEINARSLTGGAFAVRVGHVRISALAGEPAGPSLQVDLRDLSLGQMPAMPRLRMELHLMGGEPELRIFGSGSEREVLGAWQCDGTSAGRSYMRLRPADIAGSHRLQMLGAADWQAVVALTAILQREIERLGDEAPSAWRLSAARLRRQIGAIPARFRYDGLDVTSTGAGPDDLQLCFRGASFGDRALQDVRLRWSVDRLDWLLNVGATDLPLTSWPLAATGAPAAAWPLPVGRGQAARTYAAAWQSLPDVDRALVLAVLDALPASASVSTEDVARRRGGREAMAAAASKLLRQAHASLAVGRAQARLRRIRGLRWLWS